VNGYNFTERVRRVLARTREEAARLRHEYVGTEHILLALIREEEGVAAAVLQNLSADPNEIRRRIEETVRRGSAGPATGPDLPYTSRAKKVLELAMSEARDLDHGYVGTEHLLLGLLREEKGIAAVVLGAVGLTTDRARDEVVRLGGKEPTLRAPTRPPAPERARGEGSASAGAIGSEAEGWLRLRSALDVAAKLGGPVSIHLRDDGTVVVPLGPELFVEVTGLPVRRGPAGEGSSGRDEAR